MTFLIHYYYGSSFLAFQTGLGTIIRAAGHGKNILIFVIDDSLVWVNDLKDNQELQFNIISAEKNKNYQDIILKKILAVRNYVCLIANIDLLIEKDVLAIPELVEFIQSINGKNEVIFTSSSYYPEIESLADYVSSFRINDV